MSQASKERAIEGGKKFDLGKSAIDLIDPEFIKGLGDVLEYGRLKYGDRNWEEGMTWGRVFAASQRHMLQFWMGESYDIGTPEEPGSGLHHLHHAAFGLMVLAALERADAGNDSRSKLGKKQCEKKVPKVIPEASGNPPRWQRHMRKLRRAFFGL
ncbi:dATP/dGTP diphosphohydrolase domain-containing protein [Methylocystis heyeri]|uniref:dATP/dGTP diphosphohydrolase N-terminal domain-containing protein n=1 Tax=Methylocystis heyeri TaxID=391905 RepID=A0A6B8KCJ7_9HYPH|nr:dATP/dGTP diphosphohydrolase domain-containing protein [Methylocystis heyeri]QGM46154.1 hypothetical protein H2LOC_010850 [Methylocystis heyeri]